MIGFDLIDLQSYIGNVVLANKNFNVLMFLRKCEVKSKWHKNYNALFYEQLNVKLFFSGKCNWTWLSMITNDSFNCVCKNVFRFKCLNGIKQHESIVQLGYTNAVLFNLYNRQLRLKILQEQWAKTSTKRFQIWFVWKNEQLVMWAAEKPFCPCWQQKAKSKNQNLNDVVQSRFHDKYFFECDKRLSCRLCCVVLWHIFVQNTFNGQAEASSGDLIFKKVTSKFEVQTLIVVLKNLHQLSFQSNLKPEYLKSTIRLMLKF